MHEAGLVEDGDAELGVPLEQLVPSSGAEVPVQSQVGIDLATGYDAYLIINDVQVDNVVTDPNADGLLKTLTVGRVDYTPMEGHRIETLLPGENCVTALIWKQEDGKDSAKPLRWCFTAI